MNKEYIEKHTHSWHLEDKCMITGLCLYTFFDTVEYDTKWAILDNNGNYLLDWEDGDYGENHTFFDGVTKVLSKIKP